MHQFPSRFPFPPAYVSSGRRRPCRYESPVSYREKDAGCPLADQCHYSSVLRAINVCYGGAIRCSLAEPSTNPVVRTEYVYKPDLQFRSTLRKHLFEVPNAKARAFYLFSDHTVAAFSTHLLATLPREEETSKANAEQARYELGQFRDELEKTLADHNLEATRILFREHFGPQDRPNLTFKNFWQRLVDVLPQTFSDWSESEHYLHTVMASSAVHELFPTPGERSTIEKELGSLFRSVQEKSPQEARGIIEPLLEMVRPNLRPRYRFACQMVFGSATHCQKLSDDLEFRRYLGFVDLRLYSSVASTALALLVPPRQLRHDPTAFVATGNHGEIFGSHGFECSVYSMQDPNSSDGRCVQTCTVMALAMLSDRGARVIGTVDISSRGIPAVPDYKPTRNTTTKEHGVTRIQQLGGMNAVSLHKLLNKDRWLGVTSELFSVDLDGVDRVKYCRVFAKMIAAYIYARCPVILFVNNGYLSKGSFQGELHSVIVTGVRAGEISEDRYLLGKLRPSELIIHDPSRAPFVMRPFEDFLVASIQAKQRVQKFAQWGGIDAVFVADRTIERHAFDCFCDLDENDPQVQPYFDSRTDDFDYEIRLLSRDDLPNYVAGGHMSGQEAQRRENISELRSPYTYEHERASEIAKTLEEGWYWVFKLVSPKSIRFLCYFANSPRSHAQSPAEFEVPA